MRRSTLALSFVLAATACLHQATELVGDAGFDAGPGPDGGDAGDTGMPGDGGSDAGAPPCVYSLTPASLDFGSQKPGTPQSQSLVIQDLGPNDCWVTGLALAPGTDPAFTLSSGLIVSQHLSAPGGPFPSSLDVGVTFAPPQTGVYSGAVELTINDPSAPHQTVGLSGIGDANGCLIVRPNPLNFPTVGLSNGQNCAHARLKFVAINACLPSASITAVELWDDSGSFYWDSLPPLPLVVSAGSSSEPFGIGFRPVDAGRVYASAYVFTDAQAEPLVVWMNGNAASGIAPPPDTAHFPFEGSYSFVVGQFDPSQMTVQVAVDETILPTSDWSYDATAGAITIDDELVKLSAGNQISITFTFNLTCN
jgi:hypothetical protein